MTPEGFEPAIPASERPQFYALDRAATGIGKSLILLLKIIEHISESIKHESLMAHKSKLSSVEP